MIKERARETRARDRMEPFATFVASLFGMLFGSLAMAGYLYVFYRFGRRLGERWPLGRPLWQGIALIAAAWLLPSLWPLLTDWNPFMRVGIAVGFFILNAYPLGVGFGAAFEEHRDQAKRRYRKNVDDWLGEWECEPIPHASEDGD